MDTGCQRPAKRLGLRQILGLENVSAAPEKVEFGFRESLELQAEWGWKGAATRKQSGDLH